MEEKVTQSNPVDLLNQPEVKSYLVAMMADGALSGEEKYQRLKSFFETEQVIKQKISEYTKEAVERQGEVDVSEIMYRVSQEVAVWEPSQLQGQILESVRQALKRLKASHHRDGGWGFKYGVSNVWGTTHALLCLDSAQRLPELQLNQQECDIQSMITEGIRYLYENMAKTDYGIYRGWTVHNFDVNELLPIYEFSMVTRCYYQLGPERFGEEVGEAVRQGLRRLEEVHNGDGGWEKARSPGRGGPQWRTHRDTEIGSTSFAMQALSFAGALSDALQGGIRYLLDNQDEEGFWYYVDFEKKEGEQGRKWESISKTADAMQALTVARLLSKEPDHRLDEAVQLAIAWLKSQQKPVLDGGKVVGWNWLCGGSAQFDMENTCLALEASLRIPNPYIPLLSTSAQWLLAEQYKKDDPRLTEPADEGKWPHELTGRIGNSLIMLYHHLSGITGK